MVDLKKKRVLVEYKSESKDKFINIEDNLFFLVMTFVILEMLQNLIIISMNL